MLHQLTNISPEEVERRSLYSLYRPRFSCCSSFNLVSTWYCSATPQWLGLTLHWSRNQAEGCQDMPDVEGSPYHPSR